jgi:hypothetical protein
MADRSALTSKTIVSGNMGSMHFRTQGESEGGTETVPDVFPVISEDSHGKPPGELGVDVESAIDFHHEKV